MVGTIASLVLLVWWLPPAWFTSDLPGAIKLVAGARPAAGAVGDLLTAGCVGLLAMSGCAAAGERALKWLRARGPARGWMVCRGLALGMGGLGTAVLGTGLLGLTRPPVFWGLLAALGAAGLRWTLRFAGDAGPRAPRLRVTPGGVALAVILAWWSWLTLTDLAAPETFWDAVVYHLGGPARWREMGKIVRITPFFTDEPLLSSMLYLPGLAWRGEVLARVFNLAWGALFAAGLWRIARRTMPARGAGTATAVAVLTPLTGVVMTHAGSDMLVAACTVLAAAEVQRAAPAWPRRRGLSPGGMLAAGALAGLAGGAKWPGGIVGAALAMLAVPLGRPAALAVACGTAAGVLPWVAKAYLLTGDPFFPLGAGVFASPFWAAANVQAYGEDLLRIRNPAPLAEAVTTWWRRGFVARYQLGLLGAAPFASLAAVAAARRPAQTARLMVLVAAAIAGAWAPLVPAHRFYLAGYALLTVAGAAVLPRAAVWAFLATNAAWLPHAFNQVDDPWAAARGDVGAPEYFAARFVNVPLDAAAFVTRARSPGARVRTLAVGEVRAWLAPPWSRTTSYFEPDEFLRCAAESPDGRRLYVRMRQRSVKALLVNVPEAIRLVLWGDKPWDGARAQAVLEQFFHDHAHLAFARGAAWVYDIGPAARRWAVVPECFTVVRDAGPRAGFAAVTLLQGMLGHGDVAGAVEAGYAAVNAQPRSGLAWSALGDALFVAGKYDHAIGAYGNALAGGWRTSAVYRNEGVALAKVGRPVAAQKSLLYAVQLDPLSDAIKEDLEAVYRDWRRPLERSRHPW